MNYYFVMLFINIFICNFIIASSLNDSVKTAGYTLGYAFNSANIIPVDFKKPYTDTLQENFNQNIYFETGVSTLDVHSINSLNKFANYLKQNAKINVAIIGHTDNVSVLKINQKLSERRAQSVANFLLSKNVDSNQILIIEGKNSKQPLGDNETSQGRAINRRVELIFLTTDPRQNSKVNPDNSYNHKVLGQKDSLITNPVPNVLKKLVGQLIEHKQNSNEMQIELDGLLVDDTKTKSGKDFYDLFYSNWEMPSAAKDYSICISEKPFRLTTTMVTISINENLVYQTILQPRQDLIESQTQEAIAITQEYLINYDEIMKQLNGDDRIGSGIY